MNLNRCFSCAVAICFFVLSSMMLAPAPAHADIFGTVQGIVHDPQHRPIPNVTVDLKAQQSDWVQHQTTNADGEFNFSAVPLGEYTVTVTVTGFQPSQQSVAVGSGTSPVLHFQLALAGVTQQTVVTGESTGHCDDGLGHSHGSSEPAGYSGDARG